jgi:hypothetical protein
MKPVDEDNPAWADMVLKVAKKMQVTEEARAVIHRKSNIVLTLQKKIGVGKKRICEFRWPQRFVRAAAEFSGRHANEISLAKRKEAAKMRPYHTVVASTNGVSLAISHFSSLRESVDRVFTPILVFHPQKQYMYVGHNVFWPKTLYDLLFVNFCRVKRSGDLVKVRRPSARFFANNFITSEMSVLECVNFRLLYANPIAQKQMDVLDGMYGLSCPCRVVC